MGAGKLVNEIESEVLALEKFVIAVKKQRPNVSSGMVVAVLSQRLENIRRRLDSLREILA